MPATLACFADYRKLTILERAAKLRRADLLVQLIDVHGLRAIDVARRTGERPAAVSEMYAVAKVFPASCRGVDAVYNHLLLALRVVRKFPELDMAPSQALAEIRAAGLTQHRNVTRHFDHLSRRASARVVNATLLDAENRSVVLNRAHPCRLQELLPRLQDRSIQVLSIDPPYVYQRDELRAYRSRSARSLVCDEADPEAAVATVTDVLRDGQRVMATGGVLFLWQPWQALLRPIADAIAEHGWSTIGPIVWDKGRPQPGRFDSPYSIQGELLWVLHRPGDRLINHDGSPRDMVLNFAPVSFLGGVHRQTHGYEKPVALCAHLICKHSRPGDVVLDACGCTGSMSVAAVNLGRRWVYVESNAENYELGAARLDAATPSNRVGVSGTHGGRGQMANSE